jgi:PKD repeat protein
VGGVADVTPTPGGIVLGGPGGEELCGAEAFVPVTITSVTGDGTSGGSEVGMSPLVVTFTPALSGGGTPGGCQPVFAWTFAGGSPATSSEYKPTVSFAAAGDHAVTLAVTDCCGNTTEVWTGSVHVND